MFPRENTEKLFLYVDKIYSNFGTYIYEVMAMFRSVLFSDVTDELVNLV